MKLISCHIENFGKLSNKDYYFNEEITSFKWENGAGKTTLACFIKAMLYGMASTKINGKSFDMRQHFYPFNYGKFGGSLTFEYGVDEYRIERYFDKKSAVADSVKIYKNANDFKIDAQTIGEEFLKINEDAFVKTMFFDGNDVTLNTPAGIEAHINNYEQCTQAKKILEDQRKKLQPQKGKTGRLYNCNEEVRRLKEEIQALITKSNEIEGYYEYRETKQKELKAAEAALKKEIALESKLEEHTKDAKRTHEETALQNMFVAGVPQEEDFDRMRAYINEIKEITKQDEIIKKDIEEVIKKGKRQKILLTVNAFMIITAAVLLLVGQTIAASITVLASGIMALYLYISSKKLQVATQLNDKRRKNSLRYDFCKLELYDFVNMYCEVKNDVDFATQIESIKSAAQRYMRILEIKGEMEKEASCSCSNIEEKIEALKSEISSVNKKIYRLEAELEEQGSKEAQLERAEILLTEYKEQLFIIEAAESALLEAENNMKNKYSDPIKENFKKYIPAIEAVTKEKIIMDNEYNVYFESVGEQQNYKYLSQGQQCVLAFCFRLALIDSLFPKEKPFLILDDPFVSLDNDNMEIMAKLVKECTKDRQLIYFCCHDSRDML